ncbi:hypothetical protein BKA63DRAFT_423934 [Paraphoma chrysanthemicola]|nr:hypothetical protein BKA63DRAFT_423934 [Paraphoma chrysanthemicola]
MSRRHHNPSGAAQLNDFINRAAKAQIVMEEPGSSSQESPWEVLDEEEVKKSAQDAEDVKEWVIVGKTEAEKKKQFEGV